jgi:hypothetical protein
VASLLSSELAPAQAGGFHSLILKPGKGMSGITSSQPQHFGVQSSSGRSTTLLDIPFVFIHVSLGFILPRFVESFLAVLAYFQTLLNRLAVNDDIPIFYALSRCGIISKQMFLCRAFMDARTRGSISRFLQPLSGDWPPKGGPWFMLLHTAGIT